MEIRATELVDHVANALYWADDSLWTGKDEVEWGSPSWMEWRSGLTVDKYRDDALKTLGDDVRAAYERELELEDAAYEQATS